MGRAAATLGSARSYMFESISRVWEMITVTGRSDPEHGMQLRLAAAHVVACSLQAVETIWKIAGTTPIYENSTLGRRFRDLHVAAQNFAVRSEHYTSAGRMLLETQAGPLLRN